MVDGVSESSGAGESTPLTPEQQFKKQFGVRFGGDGVSDAVISERAAAASKAAKVVEKGDQGDKIRYQATLDAWKTADRLGTPVEKREKGDLLDRMWKEGDLKKYDENRKEIKPIGSEIKTAGTEGKQQPDKETTSGVDSTEEAQNAIKTATEEIKKTTEETTSQQNNPIINPVYNPETEPIVPETVKTVGDATGEAEKIKAPDMNEILKKITNGADLTPAESQIMTNIVLDKLLTGKADDLAPEEMQFRINNKEKFEELLEERKKQQGETKEQKKEKPAGDEATEQKAEAEDAEAKIAQVEKEIAEEIAKKVEEKRVSGKGEITAGEKLAIAKKIYLGKLKGYSVEHIPGFRGEFGRFFAFLSGNENVEVRNDKEEVIKTSKINWMFQHPSQELVDFLKSEFESTVRGGNKEVIPESTEKIEETVSAEVTGRNEEAEEEQKWSPAWIKSKLQGIDNGNIPSEKTPELVEYLKNLPLHFTEENIGKMSPKKAWSIAALHCADFELHKANVAWIKRIESKDELRSARNKVMETDDAMRNNYKDEAARKAHEGAVISFNALIEQEELYKISEALGALKKRLWTRAVENVEEKNRFDEIDAAIQKAVDAGDADFDTPAWERRAVSANTAAGAAREADYNARLNVLEENELDKARKILELAKANSAPTTPKETSVPVAPIKEESFVKGPGETLDSTVATVSSEEGLTELLQGAKEEAKTAFVASTKFAQEAPYVKPEAVNKPAQEPYTEDMGLRKMFEATQRAKRLREGTATEEDKNYVPIIRENRTPEEIENDELIANFETVQKEKRLRTSKN